MIGEGSSVIGDVWSIIQCYSMRDRRSVIGRRRSDVGDRSSPTSEIVVHTSEIGDRIIRRRSATNWTSEIIRRRSFVGDRQRSSIRDQGSETNRAFRLQHPAPSTLPSAQHRGTTTQLTKITHNRANWGSGSILGGRDAQIYAKWRTPDEELPKQNYRHQNQKQRYV